MGIEKYLFWICLALPPMATKGWSAFTDLLNIFTGCLPNIRCRAGVEVKPGITDSKQVTEDAWSDNTKDYREEQRGGRMRVREGDSVNRVVGKTTPTRGR